MNRTIIQISVFLLILLLVFPYQSPNFNVIHDYTNDAKVVSQLVVTNKDSLMEQIKQNSGRYEVAPENAKIDKVWKKMPGRNGLKVNIEKSYERMKDKGEFDESLLVYDQVEPKTSLEDLPPSPIYKGHPDKKMVSFLINVAWGTENIPSILNTLKKHQVKASFFIEGKWASNNTKLVKMIQEEGHIIGNHAYDHPDMNRLSIDENREQITKTNEILAAIIGETPDYFAPPSGSFNNQVVEVASELDMYTILWSVDTIDWKKPTTSVMVNRVMSKIHPGAMILMHPTNSVEQGLEDLILNIKEKEYKIGTVERLLSEKR